MNEAAPAALIGPARDRVDGRLKVTGAATYSAEWPMPDLCYGYLVLSTIAAGQIDHIETTAARRQSGVIEIMTAANAPRVNATPKTPNDRYLMVLQDDEIRYDRQPVAVVVADSFEAAKYAASLVTVAYRTAKPILAFNAGEHYTPAQIHGEPPDTLRGDALGALERSAVRVDNVYTTPHENHNPMEPHATIARWDGAALTVYDANQGVFPARARLAETFGLPAQNVTVITKFVGGGFGCKGSQWPHTILAAMAAKLTGRPVRIELWRPQMWGSVGYRPPTVQRVALGAHADGTLTSQVHEVISQTSMFDEFVEPSGQITAMLYASPTLRVTHRLTRLNVGTPTYMRAPGESSGSFALESAMDELAYATGLDPIELRLRNYASADPTKNIPFSSKSLRACYAAGAAAFDWQRRWVKPGSMRDGRYLIGLGMATASYPTHRSAAAASAEIRADGTAIVRSGGVDIGTGAYTAFTEIAADALGIPAARIRMELGDSRFPVAPVAGGSQLTASVGSGRSARDRRSGVAAARRRSRRARRGRRPHFPASAADARRNRHGDPRSGWRHIRHGDQRRGPRHGGEGLFDACVRGAIRRSPRRSNAGRGAVGAPSRRVRRRPHRERQDRPQPVHRRHGVRRGDGATRRDPDRRAFGSDHECQLGRLPRPGQRGYRRRRCHPGPRVRSARQRDRRQGDRRDRDRRCRRRDRERRLSRHWPTHP
jgi:xanthine dehydrogenase YagR molybdenum-binding subunit